MTAVLSRALALLLGPTLGPIQAGDALPDLDSVDSPALFSFSFSRELTQRLKSKGYTHFRYFAVLPSLHFPRWLLPVAETSGTLKGTEIYLPHRWAPKCLKRLLTGMMKTGWKGSPRSRILIASKGRLPVETLVGAVTEEHYPLFALSLGRRAAVRKLTVQVMRPNGEILGYIKLPLTTVATERVRNEALVLEQLWKFEALRPHIPRLLHAGTWADGYMLFQAYLPGELGPTKRTTAHEKFLQTLWSVKRFERSGESVIDEIGANWNKAVVRLGRQWRELGQQVLQRAAQDLDGLMIQCGISHGDFAPWNTRIHQGRLMMFDWESACWAAPTSWDMFHFDLQTTVSLYKLTGRRFPDDHKNRALYLLYLLSSVIQFVQEDNWAAVNHRRKLLAQGLGRTVRIPIEERNTEIQTVRLSVRQAQSRPTTSISKPSAAPRIVTTSWDDGDPRDIKIAELLRSQGLGGTFYIPMSGYLERPTLTPAALRSLSSEGFEIGAHSVSHKSLTLVTGDRLTGEVTTCKQKLEELIGKQVCMFCYPNGRYNSQVIRKLKCAGYKGARTTQMLSTRPEFLPFEMPTTLQAFPHVRTGYLRDLGRARNVTGLWRFTTQLSHFDSWIDLGKRLFREVLEHGGIWHIYGHSWEIDELDLWTDLRELLEHVSRREGVTYVTNGQLLSLLNGCTSTNTLTPTVIGDPRPSQMKGNLHV